jgi:hypothetical protein
MSLFHALAAFVLLLALTPVVLLLLSLRWLQRRNRVGRRVPSCAPVSWLVMPERPARLHRRLRRSVAGARSAASLAAGGAGLTTVSTLVDDLERRACSVDGRLVVAARASGPSRWSLLNAVETEVVEVERVADRMVHLSTAWAAASAGGPASPGMADIAERLDALDAALREVGALGPVAPTGPLTGAQPAPGWPAPTPLVGQPQPWLGPAAAGPTG